MYDPSTGKIDKKFTPVECRPAGTAHKGYNYATYDKCFSDNGTKLLPITHEVATRLTPSAWPAMVSDWWSSDSEDKEVKQTSSQAPIPETKRPGTVIPVGVPVNITVPACQTGTWSNKISIPVGWNITSGWNMRVVKAQWRENGIWKEFSHKNLNGSFDAVRYCAKINSYAGDAMSLTWTPQ